MGIFSHLWVNIIALTPCGRPGREDLHLSNSKATVRPFYHRDIKLTSKPLYLTQLERRKN